ncbi:uncharacterized protein LOC120329260 [Styela clava]
MVVQHLESRLALTSLNTNEQLHEFQIVHALITQCRKQASAEVENLHNNNNNHNGFEHQQTNDASLGKRKMNSSKEERSSFVRTISRTFNALAQATNPSLCAKQNLTSHPVNIASTVKNIISQFSRQGYHGSVCFASTCAETSSTKSDTPPSVRKRTTTPSKPSGISNQPVSNQSKPNPSTSNGTILECRSIKNDANSESLSSSQSPKDNNVVATKPKVRSVRARNAHKLIRHESAPIPQPGESKSLQKSGISVRRSKSDAVCYKSYMKQTRRKIDSNVQTKVLHFENCCKGKGQASMCLECRKHNLEQGILTQSRTSSTLPRIDSVRPKQENYIGALSYHKPSIITQNAASSKDSKSTSLPPISVCKSQTKTPPPTAARKKAIPCPGGTYYPVDNATSPTVAPSESCAPELESNIINNKSGRLEIYPDLTVSEVQCSQTKRKHSSSDDEPMQSKRESRDDGYGNAVSLHSSSTEIQVGLDLPDNKNNSISYDSKMDSESEVQNSQFSDTSSMNFHDIELQSHGACGINSPQNSLDEGNLYLSLCNTESRIETENPSFKDELDLSKSTSKDEDLSLALNFDDSSDNMDSSSSSSESCLSPRQEYLTAQKSEKRIRRTPSTRYQRMRRKLKKLISRSKSCPEVVVVAPVVAQSKTELEQQYLESMRFPTPVFMLQKSGSFPAIRQQIAMHFQTNQDWTSRLPDHVLIQIFSLMDTKSLSMLKCVCKDFQFLIDSYDVRGTDSMWVKDERYIDDPCRFCRKRFTSGDVSMCRYHAKSYHCDLPYGRSYWMCCFQIERKAPGCRTGIHDNHWCSVPGFPKKCQGNQAQ